MKEEEADKESTDKMSSMEITVCHNAQFYMHKDVNSCVVHFILPCRSDRIEKCQYLSMFALI